MKNQMLKNLVLGVTSVFIVSGVVYGFSGWEGVENATTGNSLDATVWNSLVGGIVKKTGSIAETITGVKTFSSSPIVPSPTASGEIASKGYVDSNTGPAPDYDSGWVSVNDTSLNNILRTHNLGTMFPKVDLFVGKIVHGGKTYYFDMQTNQYGDANQTNGVRLSFTNSTQFYITSDATNVVHWVYATATDGTRTRLDDKSSMEVRVLLSAGVN